ncbi:hypothetical protein AVEN_127528-1 [Araneus ventricosus]|uniref:F-box domain-containing protein n=1 Tax=Araneus ventricosus TaxID=182803 RepID=A0A4Y2T3S6_ARAVE|nr:hypothetical protein AVEN_34179-1 [Araneus ventricosus]GBN95264.1 hypothetical protein AVEN_127528-1 [Araneus ventricosus]
MGAVFSSDMVSATKEIDPIGVQYTEEIRDSETVQSTASNDTEQCEKQEQWSELPSLPLENIYSFLRREDQVNMSLVCRSWSEEYGSPSVWKTFRFDLTESQLSLDTCPVMKFAQRYSSMFRHVEIETPLFSITNDLMRNFCRYVIQFLQILSKNTQIISIQFHSFSVCLIHMRNPPYNENMVARQHDAISIQRAKNCQTLVLSKLILEYDNRLQQINKLRGLTSTDWWFIRKKCPYLQVELILRMDEPSRREMEFFIVPNMPITRLDYKCGEFVLGIESDVLLGHLLACKTNDNLVTLHFDWGEFNHHPEEQTQHLSPIFIPFLQACKKLKCLELLTYSLTSGIDVLLESWLENPPESLEKVLIDISYLHSDNDFPGFIRITEYVSRLKLAGLNIRLNIENVLIAYS